jgi:hypothetical protein
MSFETATADVKGVQINHNGAKCLFFEDPIRRFLLHSGAGVKVQRKLHRLAVKRFQIIPGELAGQNPGTFWRGLRVEVKSEFRALLNEYSQLAAGAPPSASTLKGVQINQNGPKGLFFENPRRGWFLDSPVVKSHGKFYRLAVMSSFILNLNRQRVGEEILEFVALGDQSV